MKLIEADFNDKTGKSSVTLMDKNGYLYTGTSQLHDEDKNYVSKYLGCSIAEARAEIKWLKNCRRRTIIQKNTITNLIQDINSVTDYSTIDPKIRKRINLKLRDYNNQIKETDNTILLIERGIANIIKNIDKIKEKKK